MSELLFDAVWMRRVVRGGLAVATAGGVLAAGAAAAAFSTRAGDLSPALLFAGSVAPVLAVVAVAVPPVGVILAFATFPFGRVGVPSGTIPLQATEFAVLVVVAIIAVARIARGRLPLPWSPPLWWILALLVWVVIGLQSAVDEALALKQLAALFGGLVFGAAMLAACRHMDDLRVVLAAFVTVSAGIAIASFAGGIRLEPQFEGEAVSGRLTGAFDHPNQLGALCAFAIPTAIGLAFGAKAWHRKVLAAIAAVVIFAALLFTLSRGAWIGTALGLLFLLITLPEARRALFLLVVPLAAVAALVGSYAPVGPTQLSVVGERAQALTALSPYDSRRSIYREAFREIREDPLTGVGAGGFPVASERAGAETTTVAAYHAHNLVLTWAAEAGLPAVFLLAGFAGSLALAARRARIGFLRVGRTRDRAIVAGVAAALVSIIGQGFFDYVFRNAVVHVAAWAMIGALLVCAREARASSRAF